MNIEDALSALVDDLDFVRLDETRDRFNIFEAIGGARGELRHSNFLAFLLSPSKPHRLGPKPLELFLKAVLAKIEPDKRPVRALKVAMADLDDAVVYREQDNIDILVELAELQLVVVIENKVGAKAGVGQLLRYKSATERRYADWKKLFVFLTPDGIEADQNDYVSISYVEILKIIDQLSDRFNAANGSETRLILNHYADMVRRNIVEDDDLKSLAARIYERHSAALEFIFKSRPETQNLLPVVQALITKNENLTFDKISPSMLQFFPKEWVDILPLNSGFKNEWTRTGRNLLFEVKTFKTASSDYSDRVLLSLILGPCPTELRKYIFESVRSMPKIFTGAGRSINQSWVTIFSAELLSGEAAKKMDEETKTITIKSKWDAFIEVNLGPLAAAAIQIASGSPAHK